MPLIVVSGNPCCGKTTVVNELVSKLESNGLGVVVVSEDGLGLRRNDSYKDGHSEKVTRSLLKSAVDRALGRKVIVVLDSINAIKGYRYELWCIARSLSTRYCVLHVDAPGEKCEEWNSTRLQEDRYSDTVIKDLLGRFEVPDSKNRWEAPLVTVRPLLEPEHLTAQILNVVLLMDPTASTDGRAVASKELSATVATSNAKLSDTNLLHRIDAAAQAVSTRIMEEQLASADGYVARIKFDDVVLYLERPVPLQELRSLRRNFLRLVTRHTLSQPPDEAAARRLYVEYVQGQQDT